MKREDKKSRYPYYKYCPRYNHSMSFWLIKKETTRAYSALEKDSKKNTMKIINFLVLMSVMSCLSPVVFALNNATTQFDTLYNTALAEAWKTPLEDARKKIQSIKNTPDGTKPTEMIYDNGNYFCQ